MGKGHSKSYDTGNVQTVSVTRKGSGTFVTEVPPVPSKQPETDNTQPPPTVNGTVVLPVNKESEHKSEVKGQGTEPISEDKSQDPLANGKQTVGETVNKEEHTETSIVAPSSDTKSEPVSDSVSETVDKPESEPESEPVPKSQSETVSEAVAESQFETVTEAVAESQSETVSEAVAESQSETVSEAIAESQSETVSDPVSDHISSREEEPVAQPIFVTEHKSELENENLESVNQVCEEENPEAKVADLSDGVDEKTEQLLIETVVEADNKESKEENSEDITEVESSASGNVDSAAPGRDSPTQEPEPVVEGVAAIAEEQVTTEPEPDADMASTKTTLCKVGDLKDGEMREVEVGEGKVLLVRQGEEYFATGAKCTHYGAPLVNGVLCNGKVRCPWHGACFSVKTGDIEDSPGLDSLPTFKVSVSDGKVSIHHDKEAVCQTRRQKSMCCSAPDSKDKVLIVGGGPASVACAETLRHEGYKGQITILTKDKYLPYDRPKLSKAMSIKPEEILLRDTSFYKSGDICVETEKEVTSVNTADKKVTLKDGSSMDYTSLVLATGGKPRVLPIPGTDLTNVCSLRTPDDANYIAENAKGKKVVIIGSSFIGMEVAAFLADKAESVSVVDIIKVPFQLVLGEKVGSVLQKMHEEKGVKFHFECGIKEFVGEGGKVKEAILSNGTRLPADLCVLGVGVVPATEFLKDSGIEMSDRGFISVDKTMKTNVNSVYAAGDIVEFPLCTIGDEKANIQHWQMAHTHGRTAAYGILGKKQELKSVPYFWTVMYGKSVRYTGYGPGYDDIVVHGDLDAAKFVAFYTKGDEVRAVASLNFDPIVSQAAEMMLAGKKISKTEIQKDAKCWIDRLK